MNPTETKPTEPVVYLTVRELAARYHIHPLTTARWRAEGRGPAFIKIGRRILYALKEVEAWEAKRVLKNTAQAHLQEISRKEQI